jgi:hypothetical protein
MAEVTKDMIYALANSVQAATAKIGRDVASIERGVDVLSNQLDELLLGVRALRGRMGHVCTASDALNQRLARIERRLDLVELPVQ